MISRGVSSIFAKPLRASICKYRSCVRFVGSSSRSSSGTNYSKLGVAASVFAAGSFLALNGFDKFICGGESSMSSISLVAAAESSQTNPLDSIGQRKSGLPTYTRAEIAEHKTSENGVWVTYKDGVYDITDFISVHPGGNRIAMAAGADVGPYWDIYQQHLASGPAALIADTLRQMRIGNVAPNEAKPMALDDPYIDEPKFGTGHRSAALNVHTERAFNAEPPASLIVDPKDYRLKIRGKSLSVELDLTIDDLKNLFDKQKIVMTLQCAGNRRSGLNEIRPTQGLPWGRGAMSTAEFGGVWLRDGAKYVQFTATDKPYDASVSVHKACSHQGDVLLAFEMNGEELPPEHGYPVRVLVPGHLGAQAYSTWQRDFSGVDVNEGHSVQELPVQSAITYPQEGEVIEAEKGEAISVAGYAWAGGGRKIVRVDVSADGGENWHTATLKEGSQQPLGKAWACTTWTLWEADVVLSEDGDKMNDKKGRNVELCVRAIDESFNTQPENPASIWNLRGILNNSWDRVNIIVDDSDE
eukprot:GSMAST32.ASY1.ANO1.2005.1 assembled CDS